MKNSFSSLILSIMIGLMSCSETANTQTGAIQGGNFDSEWLIPVNSVFDGGPGKDGIPSIDAPVFSVTSEIGFMEDDDLILGIRIGDEIKGYPHPILDWHEIVNDRIGGKALAITYCPLTGTGIGWDREMDGKETTFGVSGLLYNSNLIPYDRETDSNWSQMLLKSVNGERIGEEVKVYSLVETRWETWKKMFPSAQVMNLNTGFRRQYDQYPYGDFRTNHDFLIFPVTNDDNRLPRKERGMGVLEGGAAKFYRLLDFNTEKVVVKNDLVGGKDLLLVGSAALDFLVAFYLPQDRDAGDFEAVPDGGAIVMRDNKGNEWDVFGTAVSGPDAGTRLEQPPHFMGYWFAWGAFYPEIPVYGL